MRRCGAIERAPEACQVKSRSVKSWGDEAPADRVSNQTRDMMDPELLHQPAAMRFAGLHGDPEVPGDLLRGPALGDKLEYLALPEGQRITRGDGRDGTVQVFVHDDA